LLLYLVLSFDGVNHFRGEGLVRELIGDLIKRILVIYIDLLINRKRGGGVL